MVANLKTTGEFDAAMKEAKVVIDFTATWCGPCKRIAPAYEKLAEKFPAIKFYKVDVDDNSETAKAAGINAMPTFKFYLNGAAKDDLMIQGASEAKLEENSQKLAGM